jgi:hypothetical protein
MVNPADGKNLRPQDIEAEEESAFAIPDALVLASSNFLRNTLGLKEGELQPGLLPRCVTRKNPSLDNYLAELLLRTSHGSAHYAPPFEECWIRGSSLDLSTELNPALAGAVLVGIGGTSRNPDFRRVYDEHREDGRRVTRSTTQLVFEEHFERLGDRPGMQLLRPLVEEVSSIDGAGGATYDHLYSIAKILHVARYPQPGLADGRLEPQWKRAVIDACLVAVATTSFAGYDNDQTLTALVREVDEYVELAVEGAWGWDAGVAGRVRERLRRPNEAQVHGVTSILTLRKVHYALQRMWNPSVTSLVMGIILEALFQAQHCFEDMQQRKLRFERVPPGNFFLHYVRGPGDILPHRGLMARMGREGKRGLLAVYDPLWHSTMIMRSQQLSYEVWRGFVDLTITADGPNCWYTPTGADGTIANFLLNRSESFIGTPVTKHTRDDLLRLFHQACKR